MSLALCAAIYAIPQYLITYGQVRLRRRAAKQTSRKEYQLKRFALLCILGGALSKNNIIRRPFGLHMPFWMTTLVTFWHL